MTTAQDVFGAIFSYISCALLYALIFLPFYGAARYLYLRKNRKGAVIQGGRELLMLAFAAYCIGLASLTVLPGVGGFESYRIAFVPEEIVYLSFTVLRRTFENLENGYYGLFFINFIGNVVVFMPLGFFLRKSFGIGLWKTVLVGLCVSLTIETAQLFIAERRSDVDDLWLNSFGTLAGYAATVFFEKHSARLKNT